MPRLGDDGPVHDAVVVGSGPNGLSAAIGLARAGLSVVVLEAEDSIGGGTRSAELTLPGFLHDVCSAVHPLGVASPFFAGLPLGDFGLAWTHPEVALAHPLDGGRAAVLHRSLDATVRALGPAGDGRAWQRLLGPLVGNWDATCRTLLGPILRLPPHPVVLARFGVRAAWPASTLARRLFTGDEARALFGGIAAHSILDLRLPLTSSFGLALGTAAHAVGWPVARGGSQRIADALMGYLRSLGGEIVTGHRVVSAADLPPHRGVLFDLSPRQVVDILGHRLAPRHRWRLARFRPGPGSFKVDYALAGPVPWTAEACRRAGTVHLGGTIEEVVAAEAEVARGRHPARPFVLCAQPTIFDPSRAPAGRQTLWAYCHVPRGSTVDMTAAIEAQIERFAPGFRDLVLARHTRGPAGLERHNANLVGGDIAGGSSGGLQLVARPVVAADPWRLPVSGPPAWLCSASTPPGAGVHGMCGWWAAESALRVLR
ncbi:MAG: phytoene desaturase family protein [Acidimicrobiales bacterium]